MLDRLFGPLAKRWKWVATALQVQKRFGEVKGGYLASAVTLNLFFSLFPLLLVTIAVVGFVASRSTDFSDRIITNLGLTGDSARVVTGALQHAASTKKAASAVGLVGLAWSGLGVMSAIGYALDATWQVNNGGIKDKLKGVGWLLGSLVILGASVGVTTVLSFLPHAAILEPLGIVVALVVNTALWLWTFFVLSHQPLPWRAYLPGAIFAAIGLEVLKALARYAPQLFGSASALYGSLGVVFGVLTTMLILGRLVVYSSVLNVVKWEQHNGTVTVDITVPRVPGQVPLETDRSGAIEPPVPGG